MLLKSNITAYINKPVSVIILQHKRSRMRINANISIITPDNPLIFSKVNILHESFGVLRDQMHVNSLCITLKCEFINFFASYTVLLHLTCKYFSTRPINMVLLTSRRSKRCRKMKDTQRDNTILFNTNSSASCGGLGSSVLLLLVSLLLPHLSVQQHHSLPLFLHNPLPRH